MEFNNDFHICLCTDDNYAQHCAVTLCSLFENNSNNTFIIHILTNNLNNNLKNELEELVYRYKAQIFFYNVNSELLNGCQYRIKRPLSEAAYYRILLATVLPNYINRVLYLDCDIVVLGSIKDLFMLEIDNYPVAAVQEPVEICDDHRNQLSIPYGESYFNSGVLLINLKYWRDNNCQAALLEFSKRKRFVYCHDQDALNYVFKTKWYRLPPKWNKSNTATMELIDFYHILDKKEYLYDARIIHYIDEPKPWYKIIGTPYRRKYNKYLKLSHWKPKVNLKINNRRILYKRVLISRLKGFLYSIGLLSLIKNIKVLYSK